MLKHFAGLEREVQGPDGALTPHILKDINRNAAVFIPVPVAAN
jgi:hypothetical protein